MIRIGSWNVREGLPGQSSDPEDRPAGLASLVALVIEQKLDVLAMQRVDFDVIGRSTILAALRTQTALENIHAGPLSPSSFQPGHQSGLALASRVPIAGYGLRRLPNPGLSIGSEATYDKGSIAGTVELDGMRLTVVSVHGFPFDRFGRRPEEPEFGPIWRAMAERTGKLGDVPLVVCGDFATARRDLFLRNTAIPLVASIGDRPTSCGQATDDILYSDRLVPAGESRVLASFSDHDLCVAAFTPADS